MKEKFCAEFIGTFMLVLFGCGTAIATGGDVVPTALAFGLSLIAAAYTVGRISGGHINPAVTLAMAMDKRLSGKEACGYVIAQCLGAVFGGALLYLFFGADIAKGANGIYVNGGITILLEAALTFAFVLVVLSVTDQKGNGQFGGFLIGLALTCVHLFGIRLDGTSVNPARTLGIAVFAGGEAMKAFVFVTVGALIGSVLAYAVHKALVSPEK